ncbi:histone-lysine N-methyltransferase SETMAR-like [Octopus sinensis]|uniref:Histone-lysine N-methyltransferase SETMAR-like n=1 Tax=Octopus sinensis TaxID=2607531 RepID=A0A6P7SUA3_9MOLL|nr:histone-lysine N-methyltransferase SETMAR-like [Octopus sinensis]
MDHYDAVNLRVFIKITTPDSEKSIFREFRSRDSSLEDEARTRRLIEFDDKLILAEFEKDHALSVEELVATIFIQAIHLFTAIFNSLESSQRGKWVSHYLLEANRKSRVNICSSLHSRELISPILDRPVTGDEKKGLLSKC